MKIDCRIATFVILVGILGEILVTEIDSSNYFAKSNENKEKEERRSLFIRKIRNKDICEVPVNENKENYKRRSSDVHRKKI